MYRIALLIGSSTHKRHYYFSQRGEIDASENHQEVSSMLQQEGAPLFQIARHMWIFFIEVNFLRGDTAGYPWKGCELTHNMKKKDRKCNVMTVRLRVVGNVTVCEKDQATFFLALSQAVGREKNWAIRRSKKKRMERAILIKYISVTNTNLGWGFIVNFFYGGVTNSLKFYVNIKNAGAYIIWTECKEMYRLPSAILLLRK